MGFSPDQPEVSTQADTFGLQLDMAQLRDALNAAEDALARERADAERKISLIQRELRQASAAAAASAARADKLQDSLASLSASHDTLLQGRNSLVSQLDILRQERTAALLSISQANWQTADLGNRLAELRDRLNAIETSTSWKITYFPRRFLLGHPGFSRALRRGVKLIWWSVTGRLLSKLRARRRETVVPARLPGPVGAGQAKPAHSPDVAVARPVDPGFTQPGPGYEDVDPTLFDPAVRRAKLIALYLPQFHPIPENDAWWGKGFTEWRNVVSARSWFPGHFQPRLPRDLGYYDLRLPEVIRAQVALAQSSGIFGFCFYYYYFNGRRILETPVELFLADRSIDFPFCIMWTNENWTRRWDGHDADILLRQDYRQDDDCDLIDDLARHFKDPRYIQIQGRPLFTIYRVGLIPDAAETIARWRALFRSRHDLEPLIFMVQGFGSNDPDVFGLDGAMEFPPHKLAEHMPDINDAIQGIVPGFDGRIVDYSDIVERSLAVEKPGFDLIRAVMQAWDNVPRRGAHGHVYHGSTPGKFGAWLGSMINFACRHPVRDEAFVFVNAWNEWAEGTTLEPDIYWGGAYLNAVARAVSGRPAGEDASATAPALASSAKPRLLVIGHNALRHGAQLNCLALVRHMREVFGCEVTVILLDGGPLEMAYRAITRTFVIPDPAELDARIGALSEEGYRWAICNTVVTGDCVPLLAAAGFTVISLVHEMPALIRERMLEGAAQAIAGHSDTIVFAANFVREQFATIAPFPLEKTLIAPQGLYQELRTVDDARGRVRRRLGIPEDAVIVFGAGYGDSRKGIDLFIDLAGRVATADNRFHLVWLGDWETPVDIWASGLDLGPETLGRLHQLPFDPEIAEYYQAADIFAMTSREDPFPSVVLEALAYGLPVIAFEGGGGYAEVVAQAGNGVLVPYLDVGAMAEAIGDIAFDPSFTGVEARASRMEQARRQFDFRRFAFDLLRIFQPDLKAVTVVVPNYNYARYIGARLESIFAQTYPIFEIFVLDDASVDNSLERFQAVRQERRRDFGLRINRRNSGSVFKQWLAGVGAARGELVWIAEADDLSSPDFIDTLARAFGDPELNMAFSGSRQIDENGLPLADSYDFYYEMHLPGLLASVKLPGRDFLRRFLSVRNGLFNVSAGLFRRDALARALEASTPDFELLRVAGDWNVYVELCKQSGSVAYVAESLNTHRRHQASVTLSLDHWRHVAEIYAIHRKVSDVLGADEDILVSQSAYIAELTEQFGLVIPDGRSVALFSAAKWLDDLVADRHSLFAAIRNLPIDLVGELLLDVPCEYPSARAALPHMPPDDVQISWTGSSGVTLLRQSRGFVHAVERGFVRYAGRPLDGATILDYGCGWGRLIRLMYKFTPPEKLYGCDPWDRSIQLCIDCNIPAHLAISEYLPTASPFPAVKFDLIYAFSVFTHLSERSATAAMAALRRAVAGDGICVVTIRPPSYWDVHDQTQNIVDRDAMKTMHETRGFAFTPHRREPVDGDITYGDSSISLDYIRRNWTDWELLGSDLFDHDPFQLLVFLKPRPSFNV